MTLDFREFILFECLTAVIVAHAMLESAGTVMQTQVFFYTVLLIMNWICLILIYVYYKERGQFIDYNENLTQQGFAYVFLGVIGVFVASALITTAWTPSVIYVPTFFFGAELSFNMPAFAQSVLYNFALIANSEETTKLVGHNALYMYLQKHGEAGAKVVSAALPIGFWAALHAYVAYVGKLLLPLVCAAFVAGLIIFAVMWKTRSLVAAIITHGLYNLIVITAAGLGWVVLNVSPFALTVWAAANLLLVALAWRRQRSEIYSET